MIPRTSPSLLPVAFAQARYLVLGGIGEISRSSPEPDVTRSTGTASMSASGLEARIFSRARLQAAGTPHSPGTGWTERRRTRARRVFAFDN